jgi:hypothetical protein
MGLSSLVLVLMPSGGLENDLIDRYSRERPRWHARSWIEPIALESPYRTVATASSQSPTTIAAGAAAPLPQNNINRILPYRRHT